MADEEKAPAYPVVLKFSGEDFRFSGLEDFSEFIEKEKGAWDWIRSRKSKDNTTTFGKISGLDALFSKLTNFVSQHKNSDEQTQVTVLSALANNPDVENYIVSDSIKGQFIFSLKESESLLVALNAFLFLKAPPHFEYRTREALRGVFLVQDFLKGSNGTAEAATEVLMTTKNKFVEEFADIFSEGRSQAKDLKRKIGDLISKTTSQEDQFNTLMEKASTRLASIETTYNEKLALQSSVTYWTDKNSKHKALSIWFGGATAVIAALIILSFYGIAKDVLSEKILETPFWKISGLLFAFSFGVWLVRLSSKIFISHLHLQTDAHERVTMIQTYLALLRNDKAINEEDRQQILPALFRPSSTGYVKEDHPFMLQELITRIMQK